MGHSEAELLESDFQAITHDDDLGNDLAHIYRMLAGEILTCQVEKRYLHKDGAEVWALTSISLVRDAQGLPLHFIFQIEDITERKRAEGAIKRFRWSTNSPGSTTVAGSLRSPNST